ncbi:MAG: thiamine-phosphate kinase [Aquificae bacterium]|nr:thiamine-phosphate kinase [Aquificota bacterium]
MRIENIGEFGLIERLTKLIPIKDQDVIVGFGDDCSCVKVDKKLLLFTNDIQVENVHFIKHLQDPKDIGWKLISVNVSDVLACGGIPRWAQVSLGLPKNLEYQFIEDVYLGIRQALDYYQFYVIGGNVSSSKQIVLDLFLVGETQRFLSRKDAQEGDWVYMYGYTGLSKAGLELLLMGKSSYEDFEKRLIESFTRPVIDLEFRQFLHKNAKACIDISDGLVADLGHIANQSRKKIVIFKDRLPIHRDLTAYCKKYKKDPYQYILYGGEDYIPAFSSSKDLNRNKVFKIGKVEEGQGVYLKTGTKLQNLKPQGFEHF